MRRGLSWAAGLALSLAAPVAAQDLTTGEGLFHAHCAGCHGASAEGDGPLAGLLTVTVPNLTELAARNGGTYPLLDVIRTVDGTTLLAAHGGPMPVFGPLAGGGSAVVDGPGDTVVETRGDIVRIAEYLATLQGG